MSKKLTLHIILRMQHNLFQDIPHFPFQGIQSLLSQVKWVAVLLIFIFNIEVNAQKESTGLPKGYELSGVVRDSNGEELIGASVRVTDLNPMGAVTDLFGSFKFNLPRGKHDIVVSYHGYQPTRFTVEGPNGSDEELGKVKYTIYLSKKKYQGRSFRQRHRNYVTWESAFDKNYSPGIKYYYGLNDFYVKHDGIQDYKKAFDYFSLSTHCDAYFFLGYMYLEGLGTKKDIKKAFELFKRATIQGSNQAPMFLAYMYETGQGTVVDLQQARTWYQIAYLLGEKDADQALVRLGEKDLAQEMPSKQKTQQTNKDLALAESFGFVESSTNKTNIQQTTTQEAKPQQTTNQKITTQQATTLKTTVQQSTSSTASKQVVTKQKRIALVIGNSDYASGRLSNPSNDAKDLTMKLKELGFETISRTNIVRKEMRDEVSKFCKQAESYDAALFYYAGHALQDQGLNFLVPINASIESRADIEDECIKLNWVLSKIDEAGVKTKIIILDACRDNPIANAWERGVTSGGLSAISSVPEGTFLVFSAQAGKKAQDGVGQRNSPYTAALLHILNIPMLPIHEMFRRVRNEVARTTNNTQIPSQTDNLLGDFYFNTNK